MAPEYLFSTILCCFILFNNQVVKAERCPLPPSVWCSTAEVAKVCHVEKQCESFLNPIKDAPLVNFTLYFESLCPFCQSFILSQLYPTFKSIGDIMRLTLVPYGNARQKKVGGKWQFTCQHGAAECYGNLIETCAIHFHPNVSDYFPFIYCIEKSQAGFKESAPECAKKSGFDYSKIQACVEGPLGNELEHEMGLKTEGLQPPRKYVPWVTLNGIHTEKIENKATKDLKGLICETYQGTPKPKACQDNMKENSVFDL